MTEYLENYYEQLMASKNYATAARFLMKNPEIIQNTSISDFSILYHEFRHLLPGEESISIGLLEMLVRTVSQDNEAKVTLKKM